MGLAKKLPMMLHIVDDRKKTRRMLKIRKVK
jgi:PII-like signaling protein